MLSPTVLIVVLVIAGVLLTALILGVSVMIWLCYRRRPRHGRNVDATAATVDASVANQVVEGGRDSLYELESYTLSEGKDINIRPPCPTDAGKEVGGDQSRWKNGNGDAVGAQMNNSGSIGASGMTLPANMSMLQGHTYPSTSSTSYDMMNERNDPSGSQNSDLGDDDSAPSTASKDSDCHPPVGEDMIIPEAQWVDDQGAPPFSSSPTLDLESEARSAAEVLKRMEKEAWGSGEAPGDPSGSSQSLTSLTSPSIRHERAASPWARSTSLRSKRHSHGRRGSPLKSQEREESSPSVSPSTRRRAISVAGRTRKTSLSALCSPDTMRSRAMSFDTDSLRERGAPIIMVKSRCNVSNDSASPPATPGSPIRNQSKYMLMRTASIDSVGSLVSAGPSLMGSMGSIDNLGLTGSQVSIERVGLGTNQQFTKKVKKDNLSKDNFSKEGRYSKRHSRDHTAALLQRGQSQSKTQMTTATMELCSDPEIGETEEHANGRRITQ